MWSELCDVLVEEQCKVLKHLGVGGVFEGGWGWLGRGGGGHVSTAAPRMP
jgi:hypothetical protein